MRLGKILTVNIGYRILNIVSVFLITVFLSRLAGVAGYGLLSLLIANVTIFNLLSGFGADAGISYNIAADRLPVNKILIFIAGIIFFQLALLVLVDLTWFSLNGSFWLFKTSNAAQWWLGLLFLVSISVIEKFSALFYGRQLFSRCNKILLVSNMLMLLVFIFLWCFIELRSADFYIAVYIILNFIQALFLVISWAIVPGNVFFWSTPTKKDVQIFFSYSIFAFFINLIQFLAYRIDFWLMDYYRNKQELGWYSLSARTAQLFWVLPVLIASIIFPLVAQKREQFDERKLQQMIRGINALNLICGLLLFFLAGQLIPLLFGSEFSNSVLLFRILLPGVVLFSVATLLAAYFAGKGKLKINLWGSLICLTTILVLDLLWIPTKGMQGAAIASGIGYGITAIYFAIVFMLQTGIPLKKLIFPEIQDWKHLFRIFNKENN